MLPFFYFMSLYFGGFSLGGVRSLGALGTFTGGFFFLQAPCKVIRVFKGLNELLLSQAGCLLSLGVQNGGLKKI